MFDPAWAMFFFALGIAIGATAVAVVAYMVIDKAMRRNIRK